MTVCPYPCGRRFAGAREAPQVVRDLRDAALHLQWLEPLAEADQRRGRPVPPGVGPPPLVTVGPEQLNRKAGETNPTIKWRPFLPPNKWKNSSASMTAGHLMGRGPLRLGNGLYNRSGPEQLNQKAGETNAMKEWGPCTA